MKAINTDNISIITEIFTITVDETKTVEELLVEGKCNRDININSKNFPRPENGTKMEKDIAVFLFWKTTSEQVIVEMDKKGYRPATIRELLALGIALPEIEKMIIALGDVFILKGSRRVGCLHKDCFGRCLDLDWFDTDWDGCCFFAGVKL